MKSGTRAMLAAVLIAGAMGAEPAAAGEFRVLYSFTGGSDGGNPESGLVMDRAGNLYGTTFRFGSFGGGTVFKLAPDGTETVLHSFDGQGGANPASSLVFDKQGNLYGTASAGGSGIKVCKGGCGVLFKLAADGTYTVLHDFEGKHDGHFPMSGLALASGGKLYGVTLEGGPIDCGTFFRSDLNGDEKVLKNALQGGGCYPSGTPAAGLDGNIFVPTPGGGNFGSGVIFEIAPGGSSTPIYSFKGSNSGDGDLPNGSFIFDSAGNMYGTTELGGGHFGCTECGTVFKLTPDGTETVLHAFRGRRDGNQPMAGLVMDDAGNLYGTTEFGGGGQDCAIDNGCGAIFKVAPDGTETVLHKFATNADGDQPLGNLVLDKHGNLYGTAAFIGPAGGGTVFVLKSK